MSFFITQDQILARSKFVTRRLGWTTLKPGERFYAIIKGQGLKKGEKVKRLAVLECVANWRERLNRICKSDRGAQVKPYNEECDLEGFKDMTGAQFVEMFCNSMSVKPSRLVSRIEFKYIDEPIREDS